MFDVLGVLVSVMGVCGFGVVNGVVVGDGEGMFVGVGCGLVFVCCF